MTGESVADIEKWEETLSTVAGCLREDFHRSYPFKDDGEVSPKILALRDAFQP